ncbi:MAG: uracil-DNA glycosylase [Chthoniobacteraceae bacterium]
MSFDTALQIVHDALAQLHENGVELSASTLALQQLAETTGGAETVGRKIELEPRIHRDETRNSQDVPLPVRDDPCSSVAETKPATTAEIVEKTARLAELRTSVLACVKCPHLVASRTQVVFGVGNPAAELMFVGEAPGEDEDLQGEPFVGKAGQLLTKIIVAMGYAREDVYIANVLKCRPDMPPGESGNRKPRAAEMETCLPYLRQQIDIIQPRALVALGAVAMEGLLGETQPMNKLRGRWHEFNGIPLMATYHPAYLLRNQALSEKRKVWEDMLMVLERLGKPISERQRGFFLAK